MRGEFKTFFSHANEFIKKHSQQKAQRVPKTGNKNYKGPLETSSKTQTLKDQYIREVKLFPQCSRPCQADCFSQRFSPFSNTERM